AAHLGLGRLLHAELDHAVVHQHLVAHLDLAERLRRRHEHALDGAHARRAAEREGAAGLEIHKAAAVGAEGPEPDLGALQVLQDGHRPAPALLALPQAAHHLGVLGVRAVREVQARDVHAGGDEAVEGLHRRRRRPDGADDLRPTRAHAFNTAFRNWPVYERSASWATASGVPAATTCPPASPPSGPRSITQSAVLMTSRLCSMITTELPCSTSRFNTSSSRSMSAKCRPVVGSSRM